MYKVVIIDDEPIIVEGLSRTIDWGKYDCKVIATANDGTEGAEVIRREKPNIIFSDIAMPDQNGLSMIAGLKSEFPNMMITILTGYRDFEYARQAIELGVTRFLLKPSNMDELHEAIEAMTEKLKKRNILPDQESDPPEGSGEENDEEGSLARSFLAKTAMNYMENNFKRKLTLCEVSDKVYVTQWYLSKLLNRNYGQSFSEILNNIRLKEAKELMKNSSLKLRNIAEEVGYTDLAHFSKVFKKIEGITAIEYRNHLEEAEIDT